MPSLYYRKDGERLIAATGTIDELHKLAAGNAHWEIEDVFGGYNRVVERDGVRIYYIPDGNLESLQARIEKLNRRARRLKMEPLVLAQIGECFEERKRRASESAGDKWENGAKLVGASGSTSPHCGC